MTKESDPFSLNGKIIIVTGASSGIGRQCAISCSKAGASVIIIGRDAVRLQQTLEKLENPQKHISLTVDLTDYERTQKNLIQTISEFGKIHGLIHSAGISATLPFRMCKPEIMDSFLHTNVIAAMNLTRIVTKQSIIPEEGGSIVFISSVMGVVGENGKALYSMTKGALLSGSRSLAIELAARKIRVNTVSPGVVDTPMSRNAVYSRDDDSLKKIRGLHPLGIGKPEDVAYACIFLLSEASRWVTGQNLVVDGGYTAR